MKITITMDLTAENLGKLKALLPNDQIPGQINMLDSSSSTSAEQKTEVPAAEAAKETEKPISKSDIRAVALKLSKAGKQDTLAEIFKKFGCKKLSDFDSRTEDYPALMRELVNANG